MKNKRPLLIIFSIVWLLQFSLQAQEISHQVYLLGNFTDIPDKPTFVKELSKLFAQSNKPYTLILNGDLVNVKIGEYDHQDKLEPILRLADLVGKQKNGRLLILPGDRDWNSSNKGGQKSAKNIQKRIKAHVASMDYQNVHWAVEDGCPGPEAFEIDESLTIITLNTQWWNHPYDKPRPSDAKCEGLAEENLKEEIEDAVEDNHDRNVLIVGHHPFYSLGNYGGHFSLLDHFLPLPLVGLFRTSFHANAGSSFDLSNEHMSPFVYSMTNLFYFNENLIYASGHEHDQQIVKARDNYAINTGAPARGKYVSKDKRTVYSDSAAGLMRLDYMDDGQVDCVFLSNENGQLEMAENRTLFYSGCGEEPLQEDVSTNSSYVPCKEKAMASGNMQQKYNEKALIPAGESYKANAWRQFWFGKHYRTSWTQPVSVPYLDLDTTKYGLNIYKKGGGRQTTSLKFRSEDGSVYTFRSVDKDPTKALNYILKNTIAATVVQDQTSTQHPYGAMVVAPLLEEIGILHATPRLYRLPDDPKLGPFQAKYGHLFGMLEENPGKKNKEGKHFADADDIEKSVDMIQQFYKNQQTTLALEEFVRARLFDIWVGDWSKHEDNWKWAVYKKDGGRMYRPIPRDRDHVFSLQDGLVNWLADRKFGLQMLENFGYDFSDIRSLTFQAKHMDRFLMQEATRDLFMKEARYIQDHIDEQDIEAAIQRMPPEIIPLSGMEVERKLKNRIKQLDQAAADYYSLLNKEVDVTGSKEEEYFEVNYQENGQLKVQVFNKEGAEKGDHLLYERVFYPHETREVRLWGLNDEDYFHFSGNGKKSPIKVRAFGGPGDDEFNNEAHQKTLLYDKGIGTKFNTGKKAKVVKHWNRDLYEYDRLRFNYNYFLPLVSLRYSGYTGFGVGLSGSWTLRNFTKDDYASKHKVNLGYTSKGNIGVGYQGRFHQTIREWDFLINAFIAQPQLQNRFYGIGNSSINLEDELGVGFYESAVNTEHFSIGFARTFWQKSSFEIKGGIERNESERIANTFLDQNSTSSLIFGAHQQWTMIPVKLQFDLDFRDKKGLPYKGARALVSIENTSVIDGATSNYTFRVFQGSMEYYMSTKNRHPLTLGLRVGGAYTDGAIPWYKLPSLGTNNGLRGYVENRFAGNTTAYFNSELRYQIVQVPTSIVPLKIGAKAFYDFGRVGSDLADESNEWHNGYGFGLYFVPLSESFTISLTVGFSEEESVYPVFSFGTPLR